METVHVTPKASIESETQTPTGTQEDLNRDPLSDAVSNYLHYHRNLHGENVEDTMAANYKLLESLPAASEREKRVPALTICIPVAINRDEVTVMRALDAVSAAQQKFAKPVEVVLWANAKYRDADDGDKEAISTEARNRYDSLRIALGERQYDGLDIRTALQVQPQTETSLTQIRANFMEAVALGSKERGLGYDHPVMWVDADTIDISDKTLEQVVEKVRSFAALFVHPMTHYGIDWHEGQPLSTADAATKAVVIDEIMRRQRSRNKIKAAQNRPDGEIYHEESGLAFAIGTYLSIGGLPVDKDRDESRSLIDAAQKFSLDKDILPESIARGLTNMPKGVLYLRETYTTMAARKQDARVRNEGPGGLRDIWTSNYRRLHTDEVADEVADERGATAHAQWDDDQIGKELPGYIEDESGRAELTDQQRVVLGGLVSRYLDNAEASHMSKKMEDMKHLAALDSLTAQDQEAILNRYDVKFLYEIGGTIEGFDNKVDPRIQKIRDRRGRRDYEQLKALTVEHLREDFEATYKGYSTVAAALHGSEVVPTQVLDEAEMRPLFDAKLAEWQQRGVLDYVTERIITHGEHHIPVARPNVVASVEDLKALAHTFAEGQEGHDSAFIDALYDAYSTPEELALLSGFDPDGDDVSFSFIPNMPSEELKPGTVDEQVQALADLRIRNPELAPRIPSVLDALTLWQTLRAGGKALVDSATSQTHIRHFNVAPKRFDGYLRVPDSYVADDGWPRLSSSNVGDEIGTLLAVG